MYGSKMSRAELGEALGLKGKELSARINELVRHKEIVRRRVFADPARGGGVASSCSSASRGSLTF